MSVNRFENRAIVTNDDESYTEFFEERGVKHFRQYTSSEMKHPTAQQISQLELVSHVWAHRDRFFKLAYKYYGDSRYWWVIAWFNRLPTDAHVTNGQIVNVPFPLHKILGIIKG